MDYSLYFYTTYCVNATYMYGIKSMDYSLNFLYHNIWYKKERLWSILLKPQFAITQSPVKE